MSEPLPTCGRWRAVKELGRGAQGVVYAAIDSGQAQYWENHFCDALGGLTSNAITHLAADETPAMRRRKFLDDFFELFEKRVDGTWAEQGALKILHASGTDSPELAKARRRLVSEITTLRSLQHDNLVRVLDHGENGTWIVYELLSRGTLANDSTRYKGDPNAAVDAMMGLVNGVAKLHEGKCVHRDIKPGNVFFGGDRGLVLGDFGLVFAPGGTRVTSTNEKVGTTDWMPTWSVGHSSWDEVNPSFDVFALGKVLWSLIAGDFFMRLHYYEEEQFDLTKRFPANRRMNLVNDLLSKCVVEREKDCLKDAGVLHDELRKLSVDLAHRPLVGNEIHAPRQAPQVVVPIFDS